MYADPSAPAQKKARVEFRYGAHILVHDGQAKELSESTWDYVFAWLP